MNKTRHDLKLDTYVPSDNVESTDSVLLTDDLRLTTNSPGTEDKRWKKSFGFISARPHEYLIHIRKGQILKRTSGQAGRCFKWPGDTVAIIPTTLKQLVFESGQVTLDNIHVRIRGFAIYRITDPELTYKLISFWDRWEAERKLARIIGEQCRSHTKWLVSNMTMEDCIRKRKESIADILLKELRLAITERDSGVSVETVDIQDVRFGDDKLFEAFQGPSKEHIYLKRDVSELARKREVDLQRLKQEQEIGGQKKITEIEQLKNNEEIRVQKQHHERAELEEKRRRNQEEVEHNESLSDLRNEKQLTRQQRVAEVNQEIALTQMDLTKQQTELELETLKQKTSIDNSLAPAALEKAFLEKALPDIATAISSSLENARLTIYQDQNGAGGSPFNFILNEIISIFRDRINRLDNEKEK